MNKTTLDELWNEPTTMPSLKAIEDIENYLRYDMQDAPKALLDLLENAKAKIEILALHWLETNSESNELNNIARDFENQLMQLQLQVDQQSVMMDNLQMKHAIFNI